jgi:CBS domain-containing protein
MKVKEVMTSPAEMINPYAMITEAAQKMKSFDVGMLPVVKGDEVIGIVTDRDIVLRIIAEKLDPQVTSIEQAMSFEPVYCFEDDDIQVAAKMMEEKQIHRLLVKGPDNTLKGILSIGDIACKSGNEHVVHELMERICEPVHEGVS